MSDEIIVKREVQTAYVIIKTKLNSVDKYLLQWNKYWDSYNFIGGKFEEGKDAELKDTAARELSEELSTNEMLLKEGKDFSIREIPAGLFEWVDFSERHKKWTKYQAKIFMVLFLKPFEKINVIIQENEANRWFEEEEILSNSSDTLISRTVKNLVPKISGGLESLSYSF